MCPTTVPGTSKWRNPNTIGLLFSGIDNPFFQGMISILKMPATRNGLFFFLYAVRENGRVENVTMEVCRRDG